MRLRYLNAAHERLVRDWWTELQPPDPERKQRTRASLGRADSARLRRAASIEELETEPAALRLVANLLGEPWRNPAAQRCFESDSGPLLAVAGVLAAVKEDAKDGRSLAWRLGQAEAKANGGTPPMSELRFKRLLKSRSLDEFFTAARRAVALAKGKADVAVLADDILAWAYEHRMQGEQRPSQSLCFRWAQDYYQPRMVKDTGQAADEKTDEETKEGERA